jgi:hypothetical protein
MRVSAALILALTVAILGACSSLADDAGTAPQNRNPIVWLISDLGKLLGSASDALISKSQPQAEQPPAATETEKPVAETPAPIAAIKPASTNDKAPGFTLFEDITRLLSSAAAKARNDAGAPPAALPEQTAQLKPAVDTASTAREEATPASADTKTFRNPLTWLLSDLSRIFQPTLEIDNQQTAAVAADKSTPPAMNSSDDKTTNMQADTPSAALENAASTGASEPVASKIAQSEPARPEPAQPETGTSFRNPFSWLFNDLARLASLSATSETADVSMAPAPKPETPPLAAETETHQAAAPTQPMPSPPIELVEIAPWQPTPKGDLYDPNDRLFNVTGKPLHVAEPPSAPQPTQIAAIPEQTIVRTRTKDTPEVRNYRTLGHGHKSVSPDPDEQSTIGNVLEKIFGVDTKPEGNEPLANKIAEWIVPEEKLDLGYVSPDAKNPALELTRIGEGPLANIDLYLGNKNVIGAPYDAADFKGVPCVERAMHGSVFCLKNLDWPAEITSSFSTDTAFAMPGEGVVRYENGKASRIYAVFNAADFAQVIKYMQHKFGPPQEREIVWMHMLEAPKLPNTTFRWQAFNADRTEVIVLEVRNYDDLRRSFADMDHGMVRLYRNGSRPIFKHISTMDLMLMQRRRLAQTPVEVNQPPKQR